MSTLKLAVIGGDGTGPEVTAEALKVLEAVSKLDGFTYSTKHFDFGGERYLKTGETLPAGAVDELKKFDAIFFGAVGSQQATNLLNPTAFIRRIARNLLIDRARRRKTNNVVLFPFDDERDVSVQPDQDLTIEANELFEAYQQAVNGLPEKTRRVFLMSRDENLTYRQISSEIGITVATVEYHMMRAIAVIAVAVEAHR